ncbi:arginase family protein [Streptococcus dysgalactiae subsp. equisimilis]
MKNKMIPTDFLLFKYDQGSRIPGSRMGPIQFFKNYRNRENSRFFEIEFPKGGSSIYEKPLILKGVQNFRIAIGGDHSITYLLVKSLFAKGKNNLLIIFDAHLDYFDEKSNNNDVNNWNFINYILPYFKMIVVIGERNSEYKRKYNNCIHLISSSRCIYSMNQVKDELKQLVTKFSDVYISIDLDVLDPSVFPSVSYPIYGGLNYIDLITLLKTIINNCNIKAMDITEYNPMVADKGYFLLEQLVNEIRISLGDYDAKQ